MNDVEILKQQRWGMLTNPYCPPVKKMTKLNELEVVDHLILIDILNDGPPFANAEMKKCRERFVEFCKDQYKNRN